MSGPRHHPNVGRVGGLTFSFDLANSKTATITYLSGDKNVFQNVQKNLFPLESEPEAREMHIRYREVERRIVEGSYDLDHIESAELFILFLEGLLGHAIFRQRTTTPLKSWPRKRERAASAVFRRGASE